MIAPKRQHAAEFMHENGLRFNALVAVLLLSACGSTATENAEFRPPQDATNAAEIIDDVTRAPSDTDPSSDAQPTEGSCTHHDECPSSMWCVGPMGCEIPWTCQPDTPCSAAPPFHACDCSGHLVTLASGCPGSPYAYIDWQLPYYLVGTPCLVESGPVARRDITIQGDGFHELDGTQIAAVLYHPAVERSSPAAYATPVNGAFSVTWADSVAETEERHDIIIFVPSGAALSCVAGDPVFRASALNPRDDATSPLVVVVGPDDVARETDCPEL